MESFYCLLLIGEILTPQGETPHQVNINTQEISASVSNKKDVTQKFHKKSNFHFTKLLNILGCSFLRKNSRYQMSELLWTWI